MYIVISRGAAPAPRFFALFEDIRQILQPHRPRDHDDVVALLDLRHAAGDDDIAALPRNGREQHALAQLQVLEFPPEQRRAARARRELQRLDLPAEHLVKAPTALSCELASART